MSFLGLRLSFITLGIFIHVSNAHQALWHPSMYCFNGTTPGLLNENTNDAVSPLYDLPQSLYWLHKDNKCGDFPPAADEFMELPAGGVFNGQIAQNRAFTTYSFGGKLANVFGDGQSHCNNPLLYSTTNLCGGKISESLGLESPNLHADSFQTAAGTVLAISYNNDITKVNINNSVVISVAPNTPWTRVAQYKIPKYLPECPPGGCHCIWGWVPNGFGQPNMYLHPYRCKVIQSSANNSRPLSIPVPPVWCQDDKSQCVKGPKQLIVYQQKEGNNVPTPLGKNPGYNPSCGFSPGAQEDIYATQLDGGNNSNTDDSSLTSTAPELPLSSSVTSPSPTKTNIVNLIPSQVSLNLPLITQKSGPRTCKKRRASIRIQN